MDDQSGDTAPVPAVTPGSYPSLVKIDSLANLRVLCGVSSTTSIQTESPHAIYRSSKPDRMLDDDVDRFHKLGIKSIIDMRSLREYQKSGGHQKLDKLYQLYSAKGLQTLPDGKGHFVECKKVCDDKYPGYCEGSSNGGTDTAVKRTDANGVSKTETDNGDVKTSHFLIDVFPMKFVFTLIFKLPWYMCVLAICHLVYDLILRNHFRTFSKFYCTEVANKMGLFGQYKNIINHSKPAVCSALLLVSQPENLPALINCAHGKDRTGIISALILSCLDMPEEYIAEEYALSSHGLAPIQHLVYEDIVTTYKFDEEFCSAEADTMRNLLAYIRDKYGSPKAYMTSIGFSEEDQARLRNSVQVCQSGELLKHTCTASPQGDENKKDL